MAFPVQERLRRRSLFLEKSDGDDALIRLQVEEEGIELMFLLLESLRLNAA